MHTGKCVVERGRGRGRGLISKEEECFFVPARFVCTCVGLYLSRVLFNNITATAS